MRPRLGALMPDSSSWRVDSGATGMKRWLPSLTRGTVRKRIPARFTALALLLGVGLLASLAGATILQASSPQKKEKKASALKWDPPRVDAHVPSFSATPPCSLPEVLKQAGERAEELVGHLQNFVAHEQVRYEQTESLTMAGPSAVSGTQQIHDEPRELSYAGKFDYVVDFGEKSQPFNVHETHTSLAGTDRRLSAILDKGLPVLALIFYPELQGDYEMRCEGSTQWKDQTAWVIHFRQIKGKRPRTVTMETATELRGRNVSATEVRPLSIKGRAWIAANSGQVMHLETSLVEGIPMIELEENAFSVNYAPVKFQSQNVEVWLPQFAVAYTDYARRRMIIEHTFFDFQLFSVQTQERIQKPKEP
jgi:hypothetical protein